MDRVERELVGVQIAELQLHTSVGALIHET
jgi:hypothetical protein